MTKKQSVLLPAVTTMEALYGCAKNKASAFFVENCLYDKVHLFVRLDPRLFCYKIIFLRPIKRIVFQRIFGKNKFEDQKYDMYIPWFGLLKK